MSGVSIRRGAPADAAQLQPMALELARSQGEPDDLLTVETVRRDMLGPGAAMEVLVAEADGAAAGYAALLPAYEPSYASRGLYVSQLFVAEPMRGRGIGRRLMAAAARLAKSRGGGHLWLTMAPGNSGADRFYRRIADIRVEVVVHVVANEKLDALAAEAPESLGALAGEEET